MSMSYWEGKAEEFYAKHGYYAGEEFKYDVPDAYEHQVYLKEDYSENGYVLAVAAILSFDEDKAYITVEDIVFLNDDEDFGVKEGVSLTDEFIKKYTVHDSLSQVYHDAEEWANENITNLAHFSVDISCEVR